jgi:hypothetical protein
MRKEQGCKLKEMMQKKREEKNQKLQDELDSLNQILFGKQDGSLDVQAFKEEIQNRGFNTVEAFYDKVNHLKLKLNIKKEEQEDLTHSQLMEQKYHLLDIADTLLTADQLKRKRIQKMQKTAATLRENKKKVLLEAKQKLEELKSSENKNYYLRGAYLKRKELLERIADRKK